MVQPSETDNADMPHILIPAERDPLHNGTIVARAALQRRDYDVDIDSRVGKTQVRRFRTSMWLFNSHRYDISHTLTLTTCIRA